MSTGLFLDSPGTKPDIYCGGNVICAYSAWTNKKHSNV